MRVLSLEVTNFASYPSLTLDLTDLGLTLVSGPTGAGKSTLMDAVCWTLFGQTAKDGNVDEIRSWRSDGGPTRGALRCIDSSAKLLTCVRVRGGASRNDFYWLEDDSDQPQRGKDLTETQRLFDERLGIDFERFVTGAYYHEFSPAASFFTAGSTIRRSIFEKVADLSFPVKLSAKVFEARKTTEEVSDVLVKILESINSKLDATQKNLSFLTKQSSDWATKQMRLIEEYELKALNFDLHRLESIKKADSAYGQWELNQSQEIENILTHVQVLKDSPVGVCGVCRQTLAPDKAKVKLEKLIALELERIQDLKDEENPYSTQVIAAEDLVNQYQESAEKAKNTPNPFMLAIRDLDQSLSSYEKDRHATQKKLHSEESSIAALDTLRDLTRILRTTLVHNAVQEIQNCTNDYLERFFDSEIKVSFELDKPDSVKVEIHKSGYHCVYKQLSKGQRGLLRLCFSTAMMKVSSNSIGTHFSLLLFDEALDGLDTSLKLKAFRLLDELSTQHETVLVVEHCEEFKELFQSKFQVSMESDASRIEQLGQ